MNEIDSELDEKLCEEYKEFILCCYKNIDYPKEGITLESEIAKYEWSFHHFDIAGENLFLVKTLLDLGADPCETYEDRQPTYWGKQGPLRQLYDYNSPLEMLVANYCNYNNPNEHIDWNDYYSSLHLEKN